MAVTRGDRLPGGRRPDQDYDPPGPLVAPGGRAGVFKGRLVFVSGGGPPGSGVLVYSPTPAAGNLVASIVAIAGTDTYGNSVLAGITSYGSAGTFFEATNQSSGSAGVIGWYTAATEAGPWSLNAELAIQGVSASPTDLLISALGGVGNVILQSGAGAEAVVAKTPTLIADKTGVLAAATTAQLEVRGAAALKNASAPAAVVGYAEPFAIGGNLAFVNGLTGDGATYDTGRRTLFATGQTVNSVAFTNIVGVGAFNLGIGTYRIEGKLFLTTLVAGGAAELKFVTGGGIVLSGVAVCRESKVPNAAAVTWGQGNTISLSGGTTFTTSALGAAATVIDIDGIQAVVTTAGTLTPQVAVTIAADTYSINSDSYFEILPVN